MREFGVGGQVEKLDRLRQLQHGRRGEQEIIGKREDGADRAGLGRMPVVVVIGRLLLLGSFVDCNRRCLFGGIGQAGNRKSDLNALRGRPVRVPERHGKLDRERKQRQPRAVLEVFSEPVQELAPSRTANVPAKLPWPPNVIL